MKTNNKWAFRISSDSSNAMKSGNPTSGIGETHISRTLDTTIPDPNKGQGGIVIVEERKIYASGFGAYNLADTGEVTMTLSARSSDAHHVPVICIQGNVIDRSEHAGANGAGWKTDISYTLEWWTMKTYALKIRGGADVDKNGKKAGKGPLVAEDISHTIGTAQDQYIFAPIVYAAGFAPEESAKTRGIGFQEEKAPTLRAGVVPGVIISKRLGRSGRPAVIMGAVAKTCY